MLSSIGSPIMISILLGDICLLGRTFSAFRSKAKAIYMGLDIPIFFSGNRFGMPTDTAAHFQLLSACLIGEHFFMCEVHGGKATMAVMKLIIFILVLWRLGRFGSKYYVSSYTYNLCMYKGYKRQAMSI